MSKPNNSISKIKLPGENTGRPIVPYYFGDLNSNYAVTLPTLTADSTVVLTTQNQTIDGTKTFSNAIVSTNGINGGGGTGLLASSYDLNYQYLKLSTNNDKVYSYIKPTMIRFLAPNGTLKEKYTDYKYGQITVNYVNNATQTPKITTYTLTLPEKDDTIAVLGDIPTVLNTGASNKNKYLHTNSSTGDLEWANAPGGGIEILDYRS